MLNPNAKCFLKRRGILGQGTGEVGSLQGIRIGSEKFWRFRDVYAESSGLVINLSYRYPNKLEKHSIFKDIFSVLSSISAIINLSSWYIFISVLILADHLIIEN